MLQLMTPHWLAPLARLAPVRVPNKRLVSTKRNSGILGSICPKGPQRAAEGRPRALQREPKEPKGHPKAAQGLPKESKGVKRTPKSTQGKPKTVQRSPKEKIYSEKLPINRPSERYVI